MTKTPASINMLTMATIVQPYSQDAYGIGCWQKVDLKSIEWETIDSTQSIPPPLFSEVPSP